MLRLLLAVGLSCVSAMVTATSIKIGDLALVYAPPWQRAEETEERAAESIILRLEQGKVPVTIMLPRHQARLRMSEEQFYKQLEYVWHAQYGRDIQTEWLEAGGMRWRMVRRPSVERPDSVVFHLVTILDGRAHHLLVYAPADIQGPPAPVLALLNSETGLSLTMAQSMAISPQSDRDFSASQAGQASDASQAPSSTAPVEGWVLRRVVPALPRSRVLESLAALEGARMADDVGITGYAVEGLEHGLSGFLEGYSWVRGPKGRDVKQNFQRRWELSWTPPARVWARGLSQTIQVEFPKNEPDSNNRLGVRFNLTSICGDEDMMLDVLDRLGRGEAGAHDRFRALAESCRDPSPGVPAIEVDSHDSAEMRSRAVSLTLPHRLTTNDGPRPGEQGGGHRLLVLSVQPFLPSNGDQLGSLILGAAAVHYIYARLGMSD